jgi:AcrR family transcriptional regulator
MLTAIAPTTTEQRPALRRDAERNRRRLLAAAREVFAEFGIGASLEEIALRAGVGIGTLYRRFPTRTALIEALFEDKALEYARASEAALAAQDAWEGLEGLIEHICEMQAEDRGFTDVLTASFPAAPELQGSMSRARRNIEKLVARARREGTLRSDFVAADLFWIMIANGAYLQATRGVAPSAWRRYVALILDALRAQVGGKLPRAPTMKQIEQALEEIGRRSSGGGRRRAHFGG